MSLGFLFPGQGAQTVGMLDDIGAVEASVGERFSEASDAIGIDLSTIVREGPAEDLNRTEITQPAMLTASIALHEVWTARGGAGPTVVAGHSLGEYSALTVAGVLEFADAVRLVHERGKLMQAAVPEGEGAMAAILGLDDEVIAECCASVDGVVSSANFNSPGQVVIAGAADAVAAATAACQEAGARRAVVLDVSVPSHCALMEPAGAALAGLLNDVGLKDAGIPVVQNYSAEAVTDHSTIRENLLAQLVSPVRWADSMATMVAAGTRDFVECGPGKVLAGLARRIDRKLGVDSIGDLASLEAALADG